MLSFSIASNEIFFLGGGIIGGFKADLVQQEVRRLKAYLQVTEVGRAPLAVVYEFNLPIHHNFVTDQALDLHH